MVVVVVIVLVAVVPGGGAARAHEADGALERFQLDLGAALADGEVEALSLLPLLRVTGNSDSKSPLNVDTATAALAVWRNRRA